MSSGFSFSIASASFLHPREVRYRTTVKATGADLRFRLSKGILLRLFQALRMNGEIWTGQGTATEHRIPSLDTLPRKQWPDENVFSISFRLRYGNFRFFNGGDQPGVRPNKPDWYDIETPVAKVVGPVDAAILDHHGYVDTMNELFVSTLRARVWTISVWDAHHPTPGVWERLYSEKLYPGPRDVFATDVHPQAREDIKGIDRLASGHGHFVLRVSPGGGE